MKIRDYRDRGSHTIGSGPVQRGATLLEVLIAMVVLSLGILGHAGLQGAALKANHGAMMRSQATVQAYSILDRMRANATTAINDNAYTTVFTDLPPVATNVATQDLADWKNRLQNTLPGGQGQICLRANELQPVCQGAGNFVVVSVRWTETDASNQDRVQDNARIDIVGRL